LGCLCGDLRPQFDSLLALDAALGITYGVFIGTIASLLSKLLGALAAVYIGRRIWHAFEGARGAGCDQVRLANSAGRASSVRTGWTTPIPATAVAQGTMGIDSAL